MPVYLLGFVFTLGLPCLAGDTESPDVHAKQPERAVSDIADIDIERLLATPTVTVATKRAQSALLAPAAVSVLERTEIEAFAAKSPAELLRQLPGIHVIQTNANGFSIGMRGMGSAANNRVLVLLDGRNVAESAIAFVPWGTLPLAKGDIDRIEVVRGPSSTLYGADAYSGVINIVTRSPRQSQGVQAEITAGQFFLPQAPAYVAAPGRRVQNGGRGYVAWGWASENQTTGVRLSLGFQKAPEWQGSPAKLDYELGPHQRHARLTLEHRLAPHVDLFAAASYAQSEHLATFPSQDEAIPMRFEQQAATLRVVADDVLGAPLRLTGNLDVRRQSMGSQATAEGSTVLQMHSVDHTAHAQLQADLALLDGDNIVTIAGEGTARKIDQFFDANPRRHYAAIVLQNETALGRANEVSLNVGIRVERVSSYNRHGDGNVYRNANPRASMVWRFADDQSLRLSGGTAYRTPSPFESFVDIALQLHPDAATAPQNRFVLSDPSLRPERVRSVELGYRGLVHGRIRANAALIFQHLDDLIRLEHESRMPLELTNGAPIQQAGVELGANVVLSRHVAGYVHYAAWLARKTDTNTRSRDWPTHIGGVGIQAQLAAPLRLSLSLYTVVDWQPTRLTSRSRELLLDTRPVADQFILSARLGYRLPADIGEVFLAAHNATSTVRRYSDLDHYRSPSSDPIGASAIIGVRVDGGQPR